MMTHKPTRIQQLLGRYYKWWYIIQFNIKSSGTGLSGHLFSQVSDVLQNIAIAYIWLINGSNKAVITYLIVGRIYKALSDTYFAYTLGPSINTGKITNLLLVPQHFVKLNLAIDIGKRVVLNFGRAVGFLIPILIFKEYIIFDTSVSNFMILLLFLPLSFLISFMGEFLSGCSAFFAHDPRNWSGWTRAYEGIRTILVGALIPLDKLPGFEFLRLLPTAWIIHHPMQIYLGKYNQLETFAVIFGGITWSVVLYLLGKIVFRLGLKRNEAVGL